MAGHNSRPSAYSRVCRSNSSTGSPSACRFRSNSDDVIIDQSGDCYLAGPGIIFALEDGDIVSLDEEDKKLITQVLEDGTAELTNGAEIRCAFGL